MSGEQIMGDLVQWLTAQLEDDELAALGAKGSTGGRWTQDDGPPEDIVLYDKSGKLTMGQARHIARHDPARVLREIDAKRRVIAEVVPEIDGMEDRIDGEWGAGDPGERESMALLRLLALPYSDRSGFREEWKP